MSNWKGYQLRECLAELENRRAFSENVTTGGQSDDHDVKRIQFKSKLAEAYFISHSSSRPDEGLCLDMSSVECMNNQSINFLNIEGERLPIRLPPGAMPEALWVRFDKIDLNHKNRSISKSSERL